MGDDLGEWQSMIGKVAGLADYLFSMSATDDTPEVREACQQDAIDIIQERPWLLRLGEYEAFKGSFGVEED